MRFLIVSVALFACAAAAPSGLLAAPYAIGGFAAPLAVAHAAPIAVAPTVNPGDLVGASIDAHVEASDHARAAVDAVREVHDQYSEIAGQAINNAEENSWKAVNAIQTQEAAIDGAAAGVSPIVAKQVAGRVAYAAPVSYAAAPVAYAAAPVAHSVVAPLATPFAAPLASPLVNGYLARSPLAIAHGW